MHQPDDSLLIEERFYQFFKIPGDFIFPVQKVVNRFIPGGAVIVADEVGQGENLQNRHQFRAFAVIAADLVKRLRYPVHLIGSFSFHNENGNAVYQENNIRANFIPAVAECEFIGNLKDIPVNIISFDESYISFPFLRLHEYGFKSS